MINVPSAFEIITEGIVTLPPTAPAAIVTGLPATLLIIITAVAPAFSAAKILNPNSQSPRIITTILPFIAAALTAGSQASFGFGAVLSLNKTRLDVIGVDGTGAPKAA